MRSGGALGDAEKAGEVRPVIGGLVILLRPTVQQDVRVGGNRPARAAPVAFRTAFGVKIPGIGRGPVVLHVLTSFGLHAGPHPVVRRAAAGGGGFHAIAPQFHGDRVAARQPGGLEESHTQMLEVG